MTWRSVSGVGGAVVLVGLLATSHARAFEPPVAQLAYQAADASACPNEAELRRLVRARLGRDAFVDGAARRIFVQVVRTGAGFRALVRVTEAGATGGERHIDAQPDCAEVVAGAALAVSMAVDPAAAFGGPASEPTEPEPVSKPAPPPPPASAPAPVPAPPPRARHGAWLARAALKVWFGAVPEPSAGPSLGVGYRAAAWSLSLDGFGVLERSREVAGSERAISASLWGGQLAGCLHPWGVRGCVTLSSGALLASGTGVDVPLTEASWHAAAGASLAYPFALGRWSLSPVVEGGIRAQRTVLSLEGEPIWTTPRVLAALGLELAYAL